MAVSNTLPPRYEIRVLTPEHHDWSKAILCHTNAFQSPVWPAIYPDNKTQTCYAMFNQTDYMVSHSINSGYSLGVFDKEYQFKRSESASTGGKLYWDLDDSEASSERLLEQMDFPLISIAMAYDSFNKLEDAKMGPFIAVLPTFATLVVSLHKLDKRDPESWKATAPGQVLGRSGTSTRADAGGKSLMKYLANSMMRKAEADGFRGIEIMAAHSAVHKVWMNPPAPFKSELVSKANCQEMGEEKDGEMTFPMKASSQECSYIFVTLN